MSPTEPCMALLHPRALWTIACVATLLLVGLVPVEASSPSEVSVKSRTSTASIRTGTWTNLTPNLTVSSPPGVTDGSMAYDVKDGYVVLFGGYWGSSANGGLSNETWTYRAGVWTQLHPKFNPFGQVDGGMVYDGKDGYVLLFVGVGLGTGGGQTWTFTHGQWTELFPGQAPHWRSWEAMAYDAKDGYVVLYGGVGEDPCACSDTWFHDTWTFAGGVWTKLSTSRSPGSALGGMVGSSMVYDAAKGFVVLFGGEGRLANGSFSNTTWKFSAGSWSRLHPANSPSPREQASMVYDRAIGAVVLFGGSAGGRADMNDTWEFSGRTWTNVSLAGGPAGVVVFSTWVGNSGMPPEVAYDGHDSCVLLFGGRSTAGFTNDTWSYS